MGGAEVIKNRGRSVIVKILIRMLKKKDVSACFFKYPYISDNDKFSCKI